MNGERVSGTGWDLLSGAATVPASSVIWAPASPRHLRLPPWLPLLPGLRRRRGAHRRTKRSRTPAIA
jgi:hypothetical protein